MLGAIIGGLAAGLVGGFWAEISDNIESSIAVGLICFFVGFLMVQLVLRVVRSFGEQFESCQVVFLALKMPLRKNPAVAHTDAEPQVLSHTNSRTHKHSHIHSLAHWLTQTLSYRSGTHSST